MNIDVEDRMGITDDDEWIAMEYLRRCRLG